MKQLMGFYGKFGLTFAAMIFFCAVCAVNADTVNISLDNPSFEYPVVAEGFASHKNVPGWFRYDYLHNVVHELRNPPSGSIVMPNDGDNYLWVVDAGLNYPLVQIVGTIEANKTYDCYIDISKYSSQSGTYSFQLSVRDTLNPYNVEYALADSASGSTASGWNTINLSFSSASNPSWVGKPLMVIIKFNRSAIDNVRMTKTADSEDVVALTINGPPEAANTIEPGIDTFDYESGDVVSVRARRYVDNGDVFIFDHWTGDVDYPYQEETTVTMGSGKTIEAVYTPALETGSWDVKADTWVVADSQGRELPSYAEVGDSREGKLSAMYYILWFGSENRMYHEPYNNTELIAEAVANGWPEPNWPSNELDFHYWAEPELGYYHSSDDYAMRKHAYMLANSGLDILILEATNISPYTPFYFVLLDVFRDVRERGGNTPQICFWIVPNLADVVYNDLYHYGLYADQWFYWEGEPLLLPVAYMLATDPLSSTVESFFTTRPLWDHWEGQDVWSGGHYYPQGYGWHISSDKAEELAVTVARHATTNTGRSYSNGSQPALDQYNLTGLEDQGLFFEEQFSRALDVDPDVIMIAEWNEWCAMRFVYDSSDPDEINHYFLGHHLVDGESFFVDQYNAEYSRDIEPMKDGYTDDYYYQFIGKLREYKGVRPPEAASEQQTIAIDGGFDEWGDVSPEYRDHIDDTLHRNNKPGWGYTVFYSNNTGRNDFKIAKVARDDNYVYFYAQTCDPVTSYTDPNWMMLFIDSDQDKSNGWQGYDYLLNYQVNSSASTTLKQTTSGWNWATVNTNISMAINGNELEIRIPRTDLGFSAGSGDIALDFHWVDNIQNDDDIIEFAVSGDSAPDRRFMYRYDSSISETQGCQAGWDAGLGDVRDINNDCKFDFADLLEMSYEWLDTVSTAPVAMAITNAGFEAPALSPGGTYTGTVSWNDVNPPSKGTTWDNTSVSSEGDNLYSINAIGVAGVYQALAETIAPDTVYILTLDAMVPSFNSGDGYWDPALAWNYLALQTTDGIALDSFGAINDTSSTDGMTPDQWYEIQCVFDSKSNPSMIGKTLQIYDFGGNIYLDNFQMYKYSSAGSADVDADGSVDFYDYTALAENWLDDYLFGTLPAAILLENNFEDGLKGNWPGVAWDVVVDTNGTNRSLWCSSNDGDMISRDIDTSTASAMRISFRYKFNSGLDYNDNIQVHYFDGSTYDNIFELGEIYSSADKKWDVWLRYTDVLYNQGADAQYFKPNFKLKIEASGVSYSGEQMWMDDVLIESF